MQTQRAPVRIPRHRTNSQRVGPLPVVTTRGERHVPSDAKVLNGGLVQDRTIEVVEGAMTRLQIGLDATQKHEVPCGSTRLGTFL